MKKEVITQTCEEIIETLLRKGYKYRISPIDLENSIIEVRGIDKRTCKRWIHILFKFDYIHGLPHGYYEFNITKIPNLIAILKEKPQVCLE